MNNSRNIKLLFCIFGSFMLTLLQTPLFFHAIYNAFGGGSGANLFTIYIYKLFSKISFVGVILIIIFSFILIISNINFKENNK